MGSFESNDFQTRSIFNEMFKEKCGSSPKSKWKEILDCRKLQKKEAFELQRYMKGISSGKHYAVKNVEDFKIHEKAKDNLKVLLETQFNAFFKNLAKENEALYKWGETLTFDLISKFDKLFINDTKDAVPKGTTSSAPDFQKDDPKKIYLDEEKDVRRFMLRLKDDFVWCNGDGNNALAESISKAYDSHLSHVKYVFYIGGKGNKKKIPKTLENIFDFYLVVESTYELPKYHGVCKRSFKSQFKKCKGWVYYLPIDWKRAGIRRSTFHNRIIPWVRDLKNNEITYDVASLVQDAFGIGMDDFFQDLKKKKIVDDETMVDSNLSNKENNKNIQNACNGIAITIFDSITNFLEDVAKGIHNEIIDGYIDIIKFFKKTVIQDNSFGQMNCSELLGFLFRKGGIINYTHNVSTMTPQDIVELMIYKQYYCQLSEKNGKEFNTPNKSINGYNSNKNYLIESKDNTRKHITHLIKEKNLILVYKNWEMCCEDSL